MELEQKLFERPEDYETRRAKQVEMPAFPTTTIGSFPQTIGAHHTCQARCLPSSNAIDMLLCYSHQRPQMQLLKIDSEAAHHTRAV